MKVNNDTLFLKDTWLAKIYHFSNKSDPFLLVPSQIPQPSVQKSAKKNKKVKKIRKNTIKPKLLRLEIDYSLVKRIKQLELVQGKIKSFTEYSLNRGCCIRVF